MPSQGVTGMRAFHSKGWDDCCLLAAAILQDIQYNSYVQVAERRWSAFRAAAVSTLQHGQRPVADRHNPSSNIFLAAKTSAGG